MTKKTLFTIAAIVNLTVMSQSTSFGLITGIVDTTAETITFSGSATTLSSFSGGVIQWQIPPLGSPFDPITINTNLYLDGTGVENNSLVFSAALIGLDTIEVWFDVNDGGTKVISGVGTASYSGTASAYKTALATTLQSGDLVFTTSLSNDNIVLSGGTASVPDSGTTLALLGLAMAGLAMVRRRIG